jgi:DNA-binding SARP family transcriptional activator
MLRLKLFGTPAVQSSGKAPSRLAPWRKPLAVLALLAGSDEGFSRDKLHAFLWPEATHAKAAHALNQILHVLRRDLGPEMLVQGSSDLRLNPEQVNSDLAELREAWRRAELQRAVSLYSGPFLDGFFLRDAPDFERWVESERAKLARVYSEALGSLAAEAAAQGDHRRAAEWWRKLAEHAPLRSDVTIQLMSALASAGDRAGALRQAGVYQTLVREELDAAPNPAVMALATRLRGDAENPSAGPASAQSVSLVVIPFLNLSTVRRNKYFAEGLTEEVTNALCRVAGVQIVAGGLITSSGVSGEEAKDAAWSLRTDLILQGTVRQATDHLRVTVQLIDTSSRRYLWSAQYQHEAEDMVAAQEELARLIVGDLRTSLTQVRLPRESSGESTAPGPAPA